MSKRVARTVPLGGACFLRSGVEVRHSGDLTSPRWRSKPAATETTAALNIGGPRYQIQSSGGATDFSPWREPWENHRAPNSPSNHPITIRSITNSFKDPSPRPSPGGRGGTAKRWVWGPFPGLAPWAEIFRPWMPSRFRRSGATQSDVTVAARRATEQFHSGCRSSPGHAARGAPARASHRTGRRRSRLHNVG